MRHSGIALALAMMVATSGCRSKTKTEPKVEASAPVPGVGSGSGGGSALAAPGGATMDAGHEEKAFDAELVVPKQPPRTKEEAAHVRAVEEALRAVLLAARDAKGPQDICPKLADLEDKISYFQEVTPAQGFEEEFDSARTSLEQGIEMLDTFCADPSTTLALLREGLGQLRENFVTLVSVGAK
jgi:hypothetical protein